LATIFSGSLDHSALGWEYSIDDGSHRLMYELKGHKASVESIAVDAKNNFVNII
jgi:ribosome biogenesis protein YTM1